MRGLASVRPSDAPRLRRWDAIVLGGALPGLVAAVRLGQRGARVLVIEEAAARQAFFGLREPFALTGWHPQGVLGLCLRELAVPLIDRRRLIEAPVAVQVVTPDARIDFGRTPLALAELTGWGLAKPKVGRALLEACERAARDERSALLAAPIVKGRRRPWSRRALTRSAPRGEPEPPAPEIVLPDELRPLLAGLTSALCERHGAPPSTETIARRVGGLLTGAASLRREESGLRGLLRRRIESLLGEFRTTGSPLELLSVGGWPAVGLQDPPETCAGRVLVLNAPPAAISEVGERRAPPALRTPEPVRRRICLHYRGEAQGLPEGMRERLVCISRPDGSDARAVVSLQVFPGSDARQIDLVASTVAPASERGSAEAEDWIRRTLRQLAPFSESALERVSDPRARWDHDGSIGEPPASRRWPRPLEARLSHRPAIFALDRDALAPLGLDGDLLLGWRAGDAIAEKLA